jgi:N-methylhydantoinase A
VTDAAVVVGRLPDSVRLGGHLALDGAAARTALATLVTDSADAVAAALDALALTEAHIAFAIRERTVARGMDPSQLALVAAGGAGPLLACGVADVLGLSEVVVPPHPGLLAAWGLLTAPERREAVVTVLRPVDALTRADIDDLKARAVHTLSAAPPPGVELCWSGALRYVGQGFEVEVSVDPAEDIDAVAERFHRAHEAEYGFALPHAPVEWVELRVFWVRPSTSWAFPAPTGSPNDGVCRLWERGRDGGPPQAIEAPLVQRSGLAPGRLLQGPAVVVAPDSTAYVPRGWRAEAVAGGYLRVRADD